MKVFRKASLFVCAFILCALLAVTNLLPSNYLPFTNGNEENASPVVVEAKTDDYYQDIDTSLQGSAFRSEVAELITTTHKTLTTYNSWGTTGLRSIFSKSDADPDVSGNILWFYTGTSVAFNGYFDTGTNREHVWPKNGGKAFDKESNCGSDAHHLRPANERLNSSRGNNNFGEVATTNTNIVKEAGSTSYKNLCYQDNSVFYPGEGYRGATARILMYVQTRWGNTYNLKFVLGKGNNKTIGDIETLLKWHYQEPPTAEEYARNEYVYSIQGNRNPFIDHPEYATKIYCYDGESYNSKLQQIQKQYDAYDESSKVATSLTVTPSTAEVAVGSTLDLTVSAKPLTAECDYTYYSNDHTVASVSDKGVVTALKEGTTQITVKENNSKLTKTVTITVKESISKPTSITVTPTTLELEVEEIKNLTINVQPLGANCALTYTSSNADIADVDQYGYVMGCASGTATITIKELNSGLTATVAVTVKSNANTPAATKFKTLVTMVKGQTGNPSAYNYIGQALSAYKNLNDEEKSALNDKYQELLAYIETYNQSAALVEDSCKEASQNALNQLKPQN